MIRYTTEIDTSKENIDDTKDFLINECGIQKEDITDEIIYERLYFDKEGEFDWFITDIEYYDRKYHYSYTISGELGLWDGIHEIIPTTVDSLKQAIMKCIKDHDNFEISGDELNKIDVLVHHHDGTNHFVITKV